MKRLLLFLLFLCVSGGQSALAQQGSPLVPDGFDLNESARKALEAEWLTDQERAKLRVRHGVWSEEDLSDPQLAADAALVTWRLDDPVFTDENVSVVTRAEAMLRRGRFQEALE